MLDLRKNVPSVLVVLLAGAAVVLFATGRLQFKSRPGDPEAKDAPAEDEARSHLVEGKIVLDEEALALSGIKSAKAEKGTVAVTLTANGELALAEGRWARVTPAVGGVVVTLPASGGAEVSAGAELATVRSSELAAAKAELRAAQGERDIAAKNLARWAACRDCGFEKLTSGEDLAGWVDFDQAAAERDAALAERTLSVSTLSRVQDLAAKELKTRADVLAVEQDVSRSKLRVDAAERRLSVLGVVAKNEVARADARVLAARVRLASLAVSSDATTAEPGAATPTLEGSDTGVFAVRAPLAGIVLERNTTLGEAVERKDTMFLVADLSVLWVHTALYEKDLAKVREGMPATVRVPAFPDAVFPARLARVSHAVDEKTRTVVLEVEVSNSLSAAGDPRLPLRPGMFATVSIEVARESDVLLVPSGALQRVGGDFVVFVENAQNAEKGPKDPSMVDAPGPAAHEPSTTGGEKPGEKKVTFEPRVVTLGIRDDRHARVLKGLEPGETIAVENAYLLKSELVKSQFAEEE